MVELAKVTIWGSDVGAVVWLPDHGYAVFEYEPSFLNSGLDLSPIHMGLEGARRGEAVFSFPNLVRSSFHGLPGLLADALPDKFGNAIIDQWLVGQGRAGESFSPVERLCYTGSRGMGALEFKPALVKSVDKPAPVEIQELVSLVQSISQKRFSLDVRLGDNEKEAEEALTDIIRVGTSAGGARAKAVIAINEDTGSIISGQASVPKGYDHWLLKFDGVDDIELGPSHGYGKIEYVYYSMATRCGIRMTESTLLKENGRAHFLTRRFDREGSQKIHMQSLCGMAHYDFNQPGAYSYEQAFDAMRRIGLPYSDALQLYRRMVFNVIARNQDDHTKNISFLMDQEGTWRLSPAYDVMFAYNPRGEWTNQHQMSLNGKRKGFSKADLLAVGEFCNIRNPEQVIEEVAEAVSMWPTLASREDIPVQQIEAIGREHRLDLAKQ